MTIDEAINVLRWLNPPRASKKSFDDFVQATDMAIEALSCSEIPNNSDTISRQQTIDFVGSMNMCDEISNEAYKKLTSYLDELPSVQPDLGKYEYHYDHTDCIWYRPEARNRCPVTCAQYRDGWNDAMNYIFRDGKGYRPYRRGEQYE